MSAALHHYTAQASMAALKGRPGTSLYYFDLLGCTIPVEVAWDADKLGDYAVLCNAYVNGTWVDVQELVGDKRYDQWLSEVRESAQ